MLVTHRKCATCRYFLPISSRAAGQCNHPARRAVFGLVMVRAQELACQRGLREDDWQPAGMEAEPDHSLGAQSPPGAEGMSPPKPVEREVVARLPEQAAPPANEPAPPERNSGRGNNGTSPEPARQRRGFQGPPAQVIVGAEAAETPRRELNTDGIPIVRQRRGAVAEAHRNAQRRRELERDRMPQPRASREQSLDKHASESEPASSSESAVPAPASSASGSTRPGGNASFPPASTPRSELPSPEAGRSTKGSDDHDEERQGRQASAPAPGESPEPERIVEEAVPPGMRNDELPRPARSWAAPPTHVSEQLADWEAEWREARRAEFSERCCGTCRDFRASDTPDRGWCANVFAHSHRQLVSADDLACLSSIGTWWVESDQRWLEKAGSAPSQPTPLADGLIVLLSQARRRPRA